MAVSKCYIKKNLAFLWRKCKKKNVYKFLQTNRLWFVGGPLFPSHKWEASVNVCRQRMRGSIDLVTKMELCLPSLELMQICRYTGDEMRDKGPHIIPTMLSQSIPCVYKCVRVFVCWREREVQRKRSWQGASGTGLPSFKLIWFYGTSLHCLSLLIKTSVMCYTYTHTCTRVNIGICSIAAV